MQIIVTSTRAVWMAHLWESYSNGKDANGNNLDTPNSQSFNQRVLMFLRGQPVTNPVPNGYKTYYIQPVGPGIDASNFNDQRNDQTEVFIFTPTIGVSARRDATEANLKYKNRYGRNGEVVATIADIFGVRRPRIAIVPYIPLDTSTTAGDDELGSNSRGAVLFQYDPDSDGNGQRRWRLFLEDRVQYKDLPVLS